MTDFDELQRGPLLYASQYDALVSALNFTLWSAFGGCLDPEKMHQQRKNLTAIDPRAERFDREFLSCVLGLYEGKEHSLETAALLKAACDVGFCAGLYVGWLFTNEQNADNSLADLRAAVREGVENEY